MEDLEEIVLLKIVTYWFQDSHMGKYRIQKIQEVEEGFSYPTVDSHHLVAVS